MTYSYKNQHILVTGGAGFIGSYLVGALLERGANVSIVDNLSTGSLDNLKSSIDRIDFHRLDLLEEDVRPVLSQGQFDRIFHLAGNVDVPYSVENPQYDFEKNGQVTLNLLNAVREAAPGSAVIYTSSAAVYGRGSVRPFRETDATFPIAPYGVSKLTGEHYTRVFASLYDIETACVRLFAVYGPRLRQQVVYDLIQKLLRDPNELFIYGDGTQVRDMNHVRNVVEAHLVVGAKANFEGEIYNVGSGEAVTIRRLAEMICEAMGLEPEFVFSGDVRPGDAQHWQADLSKLENLGYEPRIGLVDGLAEVVAWCRAESAETP